MTSKNVGKPDSSVCYAAPDWLLRVAHCVRYNPNCNKQFEVRLVGKGTGRLDLNLNNDETRDRIGYGNTIAEAAENAAPCPSRCYTPCGVNHPHLKGVKCDMKRGHKEWHRCTHYDHWDEITGSLFWAKGRGKNNRPTGRMIEPFVGV